MPTDEEFDWAVETERRLTALEKENEHLTKEVERLKNAVNTHRHERHEQPLFDYA